jgi:hypothetical protein
MPLSKLSLLIVVLVGVLAPSRANAQMSPELNHVLYQGALLKRNGVAKAAADWDAGQGRPAATRPAPTRASLSATDFRRTHHRLPASAFLSDPTFPEAHKPILEQAADLTFAGVARALRRDNLATAMGFALTTALGITRGQDLSADEVWSVILQVNDTMAATPGMRAMSDAQKAEIHDRLIIGASFMAAYSRMRDPAMRAHGQRLAREFLAQM